MMTDFCQHLVYNILNVILWEQFVLSPGPSQNRWEDKFYNLIGRQRIPLPKASQLLGSGLWKVAFFHAAIHLQLLIALFQNRSLRKDEDIFLRIRLTIAF